MPVSSFVQTGVQCNYRSSDKRKGLTVSIENVEHSPKIGTSWIKKTARLGSALGGPVLGNRNPKSFPLVKDSHFEVACWWMTQQMIRGTKTSNNAEYGISGH
ncbi:hypothetical protein AB6A40_002179 [Gnathostoma spinigerum]|uniref:Uncharacterized protein n=1 Tax=Gnathostoma spinigerum TaxID=75299 RepID=A0ABD6E5X8_9BILA